MHLVIEPSVASSANSQGPKALILKPTHALRLTCDLEAREFLQRLRRFPSGPLGVDRASEVQPKLSARAKPIAQANGDLRRDAG
jgi:hypothetical protein